jgi:hypothetical protein
MVQTYKSASSKFNNPPFSIQCFRTCIQYVPFIFPQQLSQSWFVNELLHYKNLKICSNQGLLNDPFSQKNGCSTIDSIFVHLWLISTLEAPWFVFKLGNRGDFIIKMSNITNDSLHYVACITCLTTSN